MRKRIKCFFSAIVFLLIGIYLFGELSEILRKKPGEHLDIVRSFYEVEKNTVDVIGLGSSHLFYGVQPNLLWEQYGITSYMLGSPQQSMSISYYLLKEALNYQKPKVVLLESYYFWNKKLFVSDARLRLAFDSMRFGSVKREMLKDLAEVDREFSFKEKISWYIPFLMYHQRWEELDATDFDTKPYLKGGELTLQTTPNQNYGLNIEPCSIPENSSKYFEKIVALCEENDIELVVFATPYSIKNKETYANRQGVNLTLEDELKEKGIPFLFFQKTGEAEIDFATDFYDESHLNFYGQSKITKCLGEYLMENYDLMNHKEDKAYEQWDKDYELYVAELAALEEKKK